MTRSAISLFSGCGGLDLGFQAQGFDIRTHVEIDQDSCQTLRANGWTGIVEADIADVSLSQLLRVSKLKARELDLLIGGPPCQPFSKSGYWHTGDTLRLEDPRASTLHHYLRILRGTLPKVFVIENVPGFAFENKREGLESILNSIRKLNKTLGTKYLVDWKILNALEFGVPQRRERLIIVGNRLGRHFDFPKPTHSDSDGTLKPIATTWDSIGHLQNRAPKKICELSGKWSKLIPSIPEGQNYQWHTKRGGGKNIFTWRSRYWNFLLKLAKDQPSWTIQANPGPATGPFHWMNRRLSPDELAALQTFPRKYNFFGDYKSIHRQIGNAVPPALAEVLAFEINRQFFSSRRVFKGIFQIRRQVSVPRRERISRVPKSYLQR